MSSQEAVRRVIGRDYVGTVEADATDVGEHVRVSLGVRGELTGVVVLDLTPDLRSEQGLRDAVLEAAGRAEAARVLNELALQGALDPDHPAPADRTLAPLPGPTAPRLVVRTPEEQADHLVRYVNRGGLEPVAAPGTHRTTSANGYVSLVRNDRGQLVALEVDQEWLYAVRPERLDQALSQALEEVVER